MTDAANRHEPVPGTERNTILEAEHGGSIRVAECRAPGGGCFYVQPNPPYGVWEHRDWPRD